MSGFISWLLGEPQIEEPGPREAPSYWWSDSNQADMNQCTPAPGATYYFDGIF